MRIPVLISIKSLVIAVLCLARVAFSEPSAREVKFTEKVMNELGRVSTYPSQVFVNDSGTLAVSRIYHDGKEIVAINGKEGPPFDWTTFPNFVGDHVYYVANRGGERPRSRRGSATPTGGQFFQVKDNIVGPPSDSFQKAPQLKVLQPITKPYFHAMSPDQTRKADVEREGESWFVSLDGARGRAYDWAAWPVFSPDGARLAHVAHIKDKSRPSGRKFVVVNGVEGPIYDGIHNASSPHRTTIKFSPDNKHLLYLARHMGTQADGEYGDVDFVVLNGSEGPRSRYSIHGAPPPIFSSDSKWIVYGFANADSYQLLVSKVEGFGADDPENTIRSKEYDKIWLPGNKVNNAFHFFALREEVILRVDVVLPKE